MVTIVNGERVLTFCAEKGEHENMTTKERIIEESMKLFSVYGFEAVSIRTIADAVNVGNSALYKHFKSKQAIFDEIVEISKEKYLKKCAFVTSDIRGLESVKDTCLTMFVYQTSDEWIVMFRRILLLEKFKNPQIAAIYKEFFVDIPIRYQMKIFENLMKQGLMKPGNSEVYAMELYAPFYLYHFVDRDYKELKTLFIEHIENYFNQHFISQDAKEK